ncbi:ABC transporter substrate-binding protein [bacterium]|nr:ABC transporter substrate-binding protein [bacterium]
MRKSVFILLALLVLSGCAQREVPVLKVGFVGHDHQSALYVAALETEKTKADGGVYLKEVTYKKHYALMRGRNKLADVELFVAGGGSKMPTMMSQGHFEIGFGGVAAVAYFTDKGSPMKIISPLHNKGDMLVVKPDNPVSDWDTFVAWVKKERKPVRIGFKNPVAVAKIIFETALDEMGLSHTSDPSNRNVDILMVHMKGEKNLVPGLLNNLVDGYVSNNPWCAIAEEKGAGKIIADLDMMPPGIWKDHPCCCVAGTDEVMQEKPEIVREFLKLVILATNYINEDMDLAVRDASKWIGTSEAVEAASLPTSGFSTVPSAYWKEKMMVWVGEMNKAGKLKDRLKDQDASSIDTLLYDFVLLEEAAAELDKNGIEKRY